MIGKIILASLIFITAGARSTLHAEAYLPAIGGGGGAQFMQACPAGQNLTGFELRVGDDVDAIRPVCVISYGPTSISTPAFTTGTGLIAGASIFDAPTLTAGWHGGPGGSIQRLLCPSSAPIVIGMDVAAEGVDHIIVNNIHLFCGSAVNDQSPAENPSAIFDAPGYTPSHLTFGLGSSSDARVRTGSQRCPAGQVAIGVHGRYGVWLDAMGLICDVPRLTKPPVALGRVGGRSSTPSPPPTRVGDEPMMCARARAARARKAPTADRLEVECKALLAKDAAKPVGSNMQISRVKTSASVLSALTASRPVRPATASPAPARPAPAKPGSAKPGPAPANVFMSPTFRDGARLWACINAAQGEGEGAACNGVAAGNAYCRMQGFPDGLQAGADGAFDVIVKPVRAGTTVRAVYGDTCTSNDCVVIDAMRCSL